MGNIPGKYTRHQATTEPNHSNLNRYERHMYLNGGYQVFYKQLRPGLDVPAEFQSTNNIDVVRAKFNIKHLDFGNWATNEDRWNYVNALYIGCYDLSKLLGFGSNIGFGYLHVAFGARGRGGSVAHYEPHSFWINLNRYARADRTALDDPDKTTLFLVTGGMGSFAHEYAHFIDYVAGEFFEPHKGTVSLTSTWANNDVEGMRKHVSNILHELYYKDGKKDNGDSNLVKRIDKETAAADAAYFLEPAEMFARAFEAYVVHELKAKGVKNFFLVQSGKIDKKPYYLRYAEVTPSIVKNFKALFKMIAEIVKEDELVVS